MTLGELFKEKRLERGKSLAQISASTKIHIKILTAIEADQYSELPARAFTRGFIISYSKALGMNGNHILSEHHDFLEEKYAERQSKDQGHQGYVFEGKELEQNKRWLIFGASAAAVFAIAVLLVFKPQNHKRKEKHKDFTEETIEETADIDGSISLTGTQTGTKTETDTHLSTQTPIPNLTFTPSPKLSPTVNASAVTHPSSPLLIPSASPTATITATTTPLPLQADSKTTLTASPTPSPSSTPDPLSKGDDIPAQEVKRKLYLQALDDTWLKYKIDNKASMILTLKKGKYLMIKAKTKIEFETKTPTTLLYKTTKNPYRPLDLDQVTIEEDGSLKPKP